MPANRPARFRLVVNAVGSLVVGVAAFAMCTSLLLRSPAPSRKDDPDAGKGEAVHVAGIVLSGFIGVAALVSFARSVATLRRREGEA